jgi:hypothetical protein
MTERADPGRNWSSTSIGDFVVAELFCGSPSIKSSDSGLPVSVSVRAESLESSPNGRAIVGRLLDAVNHCALLFRARTQILHCKRPDAKTQVFAGIVGLPLVITQITMGVFWSERKQIITHSPRLFACERTGTLLVTLESHFDPIQ